MNAIFRQFSTTSRVIVVRELSSKPLGFSTSGRLKEKAVGDPSTSAVDDDLLDSIKERIIKNSKVIKRHQFSHLKSREMAASNANLRQAMYSVQQKMGEPVNSITNIPSAVSIEVLGNGTGHLRPCVILRTPLKTYMFNCPEGASRFLAQLRLKSINITDIFITRPTWDNIAGISSIMLSKEINALPTRLHGAMNVKHFLECIRPFQDSDYGSTKYPSQVDEHPYEMEKYEDAGLSVTYITMSPPLDHTTDKTSMNIAYFVELKEPARRIDPRKLMALKVPKGPMIGRLKNGVEVNLPDGRTIRPEDVYADDPEAKKEFPRAFFVECSGVEQLKALVEHSIVKELCDKKSLNFMVHLSSSEILEHSIYKKLMEDVGSQCSHIAVNSEAPVVPGVESIYRNHRLLHTICPEIFPPLYPEWAGLISQSNELARKEADMEWAAPMQRFWMRQSGNDEPIILDLRDVVPEINEQATELKDQLAKDAAALRTDCEYPIVSFLGTSSAVPSKYRNVTGYLVDTNESTSFLVDVGEGTYGQMKALLGPEECEKTLINLRSVFITHAHQDHMNGLYTIIERREEAFKKRGKQYERLILVSNRNVLKPLKTYSMCFRNLESLVSIVDISIYPITPPVSPGGPPNKRRRLPSATLSATYDVLAQMPKELFSAKQWGLEEIKAVQVLHTRMANGYVFRINGKRVVFSGDTKPCDLLVEEGQGADLLVHEATFEDGHEADAMRKKHSTMGQAVDVGKRMGAKHVLLTHFSARYPKVPALPEYLNDGNVGVAMDNMRVKFHHLPLVPKLIPIYREVYADELFEIEIRKEQRTLKQQLAEEQKTMYNNQNKNGNAVPAAGDGKKRAVVAGDGKS